jgi:C4-dicarboxylate-specific signal transduction histidine kinase
LKAAAAQAKSSGDVIDFEYTIESSKGTVHDYESRVIYCEGIGIISHVRRITQRKEYERRIADQRMQLVNSAKMAAIGEMAAGIAHEINNPLCVISARAIQMRNELKRILHQLQDQIRPDGLENLMRYADGVETMSNRIAAIVRSMWTLARDGQRDPFVKCRLHDIVKDALGITLSRFAHSGVEVIGLPDSVDFVFEARPVQVSQVLLNLLANAYDAVQAYEKKWVRIDARVDGVELEISVTDSGLGLDPAIADRVMNPFFTTKALGHGTGLGLSISRAIVEDHGGRLELDTHAPNTRFVVRLPLKQEKQDRRKRR